MKRNHFLYDDSAIYYNYRTYFGIVLIISLIILESIWSRFKFDFFILAFGHEYWNCRFETGPLKELNIKYKFMLIFLFSPKATKIFGKKIPEDLNKKA